MNMKFTQRWLRAAIRQTLCQLALQRQLFVALFSGQLAKGDYLPGLAGLLILSNRLALVEKKRMFPAGLGASVP
jgi:hypothetical protein